VRIGGRGRLAALAATLALAVGPQAIAANEPPTGDGRGGIGLDRISGFDLPMYIARAPGVPKTIYVVERGGTVRAVVGGVIQPQPFLDVGELITTNGEGGLLSIAFDPDYQENGLVYAYYATADEAQIELEEFKTTSDLDADETSRRPVLTIPHPGYPSHFGGTIRFGPDGYLYAATGDGSGPLSGITPMGVNAQDKSVLLGKVLRIDPHQSGADPYTVPASNPFVEGAGRDEIYALGLRNPFRWSFDGNRMVIGEVGYQRWEEIDYESLDSLRGANFGWNIYEGKHHRLISEPTPRHYEPPIHQYRNRAPKHRAVIGGIVVRDPRLESLYGRYLYGDHVSNRLRSLIARPGGAGDDRKLGKAVADPVAICEGPHHHVFIASLTGEVVKLVPR
jgi:glucose/arabinose dehydrogenase